ncbi:MAG: peptide chain release factor N(5)-glutamine methyltransferase [Henriciella sp.]|uniref:peptide chain release factor N(5)-glutamine methyltransferase n=1 Tax=Henriciella sp. TaxID=1968823 RepID=UPI003C78915C
MHEQRTFRAQLAIATQRLTSAGIDQPAREARHLMQHACALSAAELIGEELSEMTFEQSSAFFDLVERRASGEPFEYVTGTACFYGLELECSPATLIPRPDSEVVVDEALTRLPLGRTARIADLGTGTGCLLIALLKNQPGTTGIGIERSSRAAQVATANLRRHGLSARASIETGSWDDWTGWGETDLIISNPPYIASDIIETLDESVRSHEPHIALDGGADGLAAYRSIIHLARSQMKPGAWLVFEIGYDQGKAVTSLLEKAGFDAISCGQDLGERDRVVSARR